MKEADSDNSATAATTTTTDTANDDVIIQKTADDALLTKIAAVEAGYYEDPFLGISKKQAQRIPSSNRVTGGDVLLASSSAHCPRRHRPMEPLIKRGTHARVCVMDRAISAFFRLVVADAVRNNDDETNDKNTTTTTAQVLVLGAGKDTSYFRYQAGLLLEETNNNNNTVDAAAAAAAADGMNKNLNVNWYEVDHASLIQEKANAIRENERIFHVTVEPLQKTASSSFTDGGGCGGDDCIGFNLSPIIASQQQQATTPKTGPLFKYTPPSNHRVGHNNSTCFLVAHDLRQSTNLLFEKLQKKARFDASLPTLILMECVLMYMPENTSRMLLQSLSRHCINSCLCTYEPILDGGKSSSLSSSSLPSKRDPFGKVMEDNLIKAGVAKPDRSILQTRTLKQQLSKQVLANNSDGDGGDDAGGGGFAMAVGCDMWSAYETILTPQQRQRANACEFLDEMEEFVLIMKHYCFTAACTSGCSIGPHFCHVSAAAAPIPVFAPVGSSASKTKSKADAVEDSDASPLGFVRGKSETVTRNR